MHKLRPYVLPFAIVVGLVFHRYLVYVRQLTPYLIFSILLLNNVAVDMKKLKITMLDVCWAAISSSRHSAPASRSLRAY